MPVKTIRQGLRFNGLNDYVNCGIITATNTGSVSLHARFVPTTNPPSHEGIAGIRNNANCDFYILQLLESTNFECRFRNVAGANVDHVITLTPGIPCEVTMVYDGSSFKVYVNGALVGSKAASGDMGNSTKPFMIGQSPDPLGYFKKGIIENVRLYKRALTASEIASKSFARNGLVGEWLMNEGAGTTLTDTSGNSNHGTIVGATWILKTIRQGVKTDGVSSYIQLPQNVAGFGLKGGYELEFTVNGLSNVESYILASGTNFRTYLSVSPSGLLRFTKGNPASTVTWLNSVQLGVKYKVRIEWDNGVAYGYVNDVLTVTIPAFADNSDGNGIVRVGCIHSSISSLTAITLHSMRQYVGNVNKAVYPCNEGTGTTLTDTSGNGNHGTIVGATWVLKKVPLRPRKNLIPAFTDSRWVLHENTRMAQANFVDKVSGSTVENPNIFKRIASTTLQAPNNAGWVEQNNNNDWSGYPSVATLGGGTLAVALSSINGQQAQHLFSFNLIEHVLRKYGDIFGSAVTTAERVAWLKVNIAKFNCNWYGFGSGPLGNKASLSIWTYATNIWTNTASHTSGSVSKLNLIRSSVIDMVISTDGFVYFLAYASDASDGVTASTINTDFVELEVVLTESAYAPVRAREPYKLTMNATVNSQLSTIELIAKPNTSYTLSGVTSADNAFISFSSVNASNVASFVGEIRGGITVVTRTTPADCVKLLIKVLNFNDAVGTFTFDKPQLELAPATPWEPYTLINDVKPVTTMKPKKNLLQDFTKWTLFNNGKAITLANLAGKVQGSTTENPHRAQAAGTSNVLLPPSSGTWGEFDPTSYQRIKLLSDEPLLSYDSGNRAQMLFSFNLIEQVQRSYNMTIPGADTAAKVAWLNANIIQLNFNWYGYGQGGTGAFKATVTAWRSDTNAWSNTEVSHTLSTPTKLLYQTAPPNLYIDAAGFVFFLAYAELGDVDNYFSNIKMDYVELAAELKPGGSIVPNAVVDPVNPYKLTLNATASTQPSYYLVNVLPNTDYTIKGTYNGRVGIYSANASSVIVGYESMATDTPKTFNTGSNTQLRVYCSNDTLGAGTFTFEKPQLERGTSATTWEPYQLVRDVKGVL